LALFLPHLPLMIRRVLHILCSLWLVVLLLFGNTPAELIHTFAHHKDTVHHRAEGQTIDAQHHHCQFLGFHLMPFAVPPSLLNPLRVKADAYVAAPSMQDEQAIQQTLIIREKRGPPVA
jgi:hypothetical protein